MTGNILNLAIDGKDIMIIVLSVCLGGLFFLWIKSQKQGKTVILENEKLEEQYKLMEEINERAKNLGHHQRLEMMGMLTAGIAHEFNNLLTPIMGYSLMILEKLDGEDSELYDEVLEIYQNSVKARNVISRLRDLSGKHQDAIKQEIDFDELIRKMIRTAKPARPNNVDVQLELKAKEEKIWGNEIQLSQLLLNLILNSYQAMEKKKGILEICTLVEQSYLNVVVKDTGEGIKEEDLPHIFEPFFTTKEGGKGTGLGMAIVSHVVEDHQGEIFVESKRGIGTKITVKIPCAKKNRNLNNY